MNIILDRFGKNEVDYFINFFSENGYVPKIATIISEKDISERRQGCDVYGDFDIARGSMAQYVDWCLDDDEIDNLSNYEGLFIKLASRFVVFPGEWKPLEISDYYFMLANFWVEKIRSKNIDACVSSCLPHEPSSFSLYIVSKLLKIPFVFVDIPRAARRIRFVSCSYANRNLMLRSGECSTPFWAKKIITEYIDDLKIDFESAQPFYMDVVNQRIHMTFKQNLFIRQEKLRKNVARIVNQEKSLVHIIRYLIKKIYCKVLPPVPLYSKISRKSWSSHDYSKPLRMRWFFTRALAKWRIRRLSRQYGRLMRNGGIESLSEKFIYFPLPLEPEASTIPTALAYGSVLIAIKRILSELPSDFVMVLKINPVQFQDALHEISTFPEWHGSDFYKELSSLKKVIFVSEKCKSGDLIKHCSGLACINGTAAMEAAALGKHAMIFSPMWYDSLENIHLVKEQHDIKSAIALMITNGEYSDCDPDRIKMSPEMIFDNHGLDAFGTERHILESIGRCLIAGLQVFPLLDDSKWEV